MLWLVPAAVAAALSGWVDSRPKRERASWEMDLSGRGRSRVFNFAMVFFTSMAGVASTDGSMAFWVRMAVILMAVGVPLGLASLVRKRRDKVTLPEAGKG